MQSENKTNSSKALVVYYSRSGNTEALARMIGNETGADMFRVTTVTPYPEVYRETTELARAERDNNARPAINGRVENMADYDVVYIGVPNWWSTMPMPMFTFLEQYDLSGKTIVPFVTHGGGCWLAFLPPLGACSVPYAALWPVSPPHPPGRSGNCPLSW